MDKRNISQIAVLDSYSATPVTLAGGKMTVPNPTTGKGWGAPLITALGVEYTKTAYAAGTAFAKTFTFPATPTPSTPYTITMFFPNAVAFPTGGQEENALFKVETYTVYTAASGETGTTLAQKFEDRIDANAYSRMTAANVGAVLTVTQKAASLAIGDGDSVNSTANADVTLGTTTPYVAPSGTATIVNQIAGDNSATASQYTTYDILCYNPTTNPIVNGQYALAKTRFVIFINDAEADYAAAETLIDAILAGTHTAALYLGID